MTSAIDSGIEYESTLQKMEYDIPIREELNRLMDETYCDIDDFITIPKQEDPLIFTHKKIFQLEYPGIRSAWLNIQLLPTVTTEEDLEEVEYCLKSDESTGGKIPVFYARIRISFSHYIVNLKYKYT